MFMVSVLGVTIVATVRSIDAVDFLNWSIAYRHLAIFRDSKLVCNISAIDLQDVKFLSDKLLLVVCPLVHNGSCITSTQDPVGDELDHFCVLQGMHVALV